LPEIPELTILRDNLARFIKGKTLTEFRILKPYVQKTTVPDNLTGQRITGISRRGKYITIDLQRHRLIVHLMLSGRFKLLTKGKELYKSAAALLGFEGVSIQLVEEAKLKRMSLWILDRQARVDDIKPLGIESLSENFTEECLADLASGSRERLKGFLLNQRRLAGIGNAYANEICWRARLSPFKQANKLNVEEIKRFHSAITDTLRQAIEAVRKIAGDRIDIPEKRTFLVIHRRKGQPCPACGTKIEWVSSSRDTFYCPGCQTGGRILKDRRTSKFLK
jgi:formamidopyrimidine-DNA glycosylase